MPHSLRRSLFSIWLPRAVIPMMLGVELLFSALSTAQMHTDSPTGGTMSATKTDVFVMGGSDFNRPGLLPRANLSIGIGHTFGILKRDPLGDEVIGSYTYENAGTHGFIHTRFGEHTEALGIMRNFPVPHVAHLDGYTWLQSGITSYTGNASVENRLASSAILGAMLHLTVRDSIWFQESYNKVVTVPWYTTTSLGYVFSF